MEFLGKADIGAAVMTALGRATRVRIASAFFGPSNETIAALNAVKELTLIVSEEFTFNSPVLLAKLTTKKLLSVPPEHEAGKLHAKMFLADMPDGSTWALLGSANLTHTGLFSNQEACLALSSDVEGDAEAIDQMEEWFASILKISRPLDLVHARAVWERRGKQKLVPTAGKNTAAPAYWALKTTEGGGKLSTDFWPMFESEGVVALGWEKIAVNPAHAAPSDLRHAIHAAYPGEPGAEAFAFRKLTDFAELPVDSIILVCRGYTPNQSDDDPVYVYALARVIGELEAAPYVAGQWRFKRKAVLQPVRESLPVRRMKVLLGLGSMRQTMHRLERHNVEAVASELGIHIEV